MSIISEKSLMAIIDDVKKFFDAADALKLTDEMVNDLIVERQREADESHDLIEQIQFKMCEHEQISREMVRSS